MSAALPEVAGGESTGTGFLSQASTTTSDEARIEAKRVRMGPGMVGGWVAAVKGPLPGRREVAPLAQKYSATVPSTVRGGAATMWTASDAGCCPGFRLQLDT